MPTYTQEPSADNQIKDDNPTINWATFPSDNLDVGELAAGFQISRSLLKWDLSSLAGFVVSSAVLSIYDRGVDLTDNARTMRAYRVLRAWTESGSTWIDYATSTAWGTLGCGNTTTDREAADIGSVSLPNPPVTGFVDIALTAAKVQEWVDGTLANNGVLLQLDTETDDMHRFNSRRYATGAERPKLTIQYAPAIGPSGIVGPSLLAASAATIYTVPALTKTVINSIRASNPAGGSNRTVTVSIGTDAAGTRIIGAETVATGTDREWQGPWTLGAGEIVQAFASAASEVELTIDADVYVLGMNVA